MTAMLEHIALVNAYVRLAHAASVARVGAIERAQIEAEAMGELDQSQHAQSEFGFCVARAIAAAKSSVAGLLRHVHGPVGAVLPRRQGEDFARLGDMLLVNAYLILARAAERGRCVEALQTKIETDVMQALREFEAQIDHPAAPAVQALDAARRMLSDVFAQAKRI